MTKLRLIIAWMFLTHGVGGTGEELESIGKKTAGEVIDAEVQHRSSTHLSIKIDAVPDARDSASGDAENRRSTVRESRGFTADETTASRISVAKDGRTKDVDEKSSEFKLEVESEVSGNESDEDAAAVRSVSIRRTLMKFRFHLLKPGFHYPS